MDNPQGPAVDQGTLLNVMWLPGWEGSLGENGYMHMYDCSPETVITLLISYIWLQNKKFKEKKIKKGRQ